MGGGKKKQSRRNPAERKESLEEKRVELLTFVGKGKGKKGMADIGIVGKV